MTTQPAFKPRVLIFDTTGELSEAARHFIIDYATAAHASGTTPMSLALSGGSTPRRLYESIHQHNHDLVCKQRTITFVMGDERLVPRSDVLANYHMAYEALLRDVPQENVLTPDPTPAVNTAYDAAAGEHGARIVAGAYEDTLLRHLPVQTIVSQSGTKVQIPALDIVLLGFGADGHTASIFPQSIAARDEQHSVSISYPSETMHPKVWRVTLTPHVIQHAKHVIVLAAGKDKNWVIRGILDDTVTDEIPVSRFLRECKHTVTFLLDKEAASGVAESPL